MNQGWLGWIALVPLLFLVPAPRQGQWPGPYVSSWLGGLMFCLAAFQWIRIASAPMYATWIALAFTLSLQFPLFIWLTRRLTRTLHWPLLLAAPMTWTALEATRAYLWVGFAWYYLGHTQHDHAAILQLADLFGASGITFLLVVVNVTIFQTLSQLLQQAPGRFPRVEWGITAALLVLAGGYGTVRLHDTGHTRPGPKVALVQGNLPQDIRNDPGEGDRMNRHYLDLCVEAAARRPDLLVTSETCFSFWWMRIADGVVPAAADAERWRKFDQESVGFARTAAERWETNLLLGMSAEILEADGPRKYNSAIFIERDGRIGPRYDKMVCLPFGEYIPFENALPFMKWFSPYGPNTNYSITAGNRYVVFPWKDHPFAVLICYEDTLPQLATRFMNQPVVPAFFLNISNDGWFKGWEEHEQHLVAARFRAVECRRAVTRAVNMGISCIIDGNGNVVALPEGAKSWSEAKAIATVVTGEIPLDTRTSLYVRIGDLLPAGCWLAILIGMGLALYRAHREERRAAVTAA